MIMPTDTTDSTTFTPAHVPTEQELASFDHREVPSPVQIKGDVRISAEPTLAGLPPEMRDRVRAKLSTVRGDRDIFERQFIQEELEANSYRLKVLAGPGKDANEYERECFGIMRELYDLESEAARIEADINDTVGYSTDYDADGNPIAVPVYRFAPETRQGRQNALQDVRYRITQVEREAPARRAAAAKRVQDRIKYLNEEFAIEAAARAKAEETNRQLRIDEKAAAYAKNRRHTID
jgi:chromosome segregation ATPase